MKTNFTFYLKSSLMVLFLGLGLSSWGQTETIFSENMGNPSSNTLVNDFTGFQNYGTLIFTGSSTTDIRTTSPSDGYAGASGGGNVLLNNTTKYIEISGINTTNYSSLVLSFGVRKGTNAVTQPVIVEVSDDGVNYSQLTYTNLPSGSGSSGWYYITASGELPSTSNLRIKFTGNDGTNDVRLDDVKLVGTPLPTSDHTITVTQPTGGEITPGTTGVDDGESASFTATPESSCYTFSHWIVDGENAGNTNPYVFTNVTGDHTISAVFEAVAPYTIRATAGANGSISPNGATSVNCGADQTFTITADSGYAVADVLVNGVSVGAVTTYTFENVTEDQTISASFVEFTGPCGNEDFETTDISFGSYGDGSFTNNGITWTYAHSRSEGDYPIENKGLMLRNAKDSYLEATISGGIGTFSFDYRKAFTGSYPRQLELIVDGVQVATTDEFGGFSGEDDTIYNLSYDINTTETVTIRIKNVGETDENRQTVIDNITWTCYSPVIWTTDDEWSNVTGPTINDDVVIEGVLFVGTDFPSFEAKSLTVASSGAINIESGNSVTVAGAIDNQAGANNFIIEAGGNLVQDDPTAVNTGDITVEVKAKTEYYGYNMFSSPVAGQTFSGFSNVTGTEGLEVYTYNYEDEDNHGYEQVTGTDFEEGLGYLFAAPYDGFPQGVPTEFTGEFVGVPHNGTVSIPVVYSFTALGNPYPSAIDANDFLAANSNVGTLYFWTNTHFYDAVTSAYPGNNYATYTLVGGVGTGEQAEAGGNAFPTPNGAIQTGQGFIAGIATGGTITFDNTMRFATGGTFYKVMEEDKHRLWLSLADQNNELNQILVGYMEGASQGVDTGIDGPMFGYDGSALYSLIENSDTNYVIQGRYPFATADVVPLGFRAIEGGSYTISLANFDGLFADGQDIYLKDNATQTYHDLKDGAYTFVSDQGIFDSRFEVVYQADGGLNTNNPTLDNKWIVYSKDNGFQIEAQGFEMKEVMVYDMLGRLIYNNQAEGTSHAISNIANGVLIVKVITTENQVLTRKTAK